MLTVAYCRVSTDEQAAEGFSIEGQAERLRAYAALHELGEVTVITDPGLSGKDLNRPGLQQILAMVDAGHVSAVLTWRLDRLSRSLADLILLADRFGQANVALHSFTERIDLSSATGRMFYNVLGSFAQFYREQLSENVAMGQAQAMREGRWCNRPPTGYDLVGGFLTPNERAPVVRQIFRLRGEGATQSEISSVTGVNYSTVLSILRNRAYLGEIRHLEDWLPGRHEPLVSSAEFDAAHRGRIPGRRRGADLMSGRVVCGLCGRRMSIMPNGQGHAHYRCRHRGSGCSQPARSNKGLLKAAVLGLRLLGEDTELRDVIRRQLDGGRRASPQGGRRPSISTSALDSLLDQRRKLLTLHYEGHISADQFGEEQARLTLRIEGLQQESTQARAEALKADDVASRFGEVAALLESLDIDRLWSAATDRERRSLLDEMLDRVAVHPDHLEVTIHGAPRLNVLLSEVGLKKSQIGGVGGATSPDRDWRLSQW